MGSLNQYLHYSDHLYLTGQGLGLARMLSLSDNHVHDRNLWQCDIALHVSRRPSTLLDGLLVNHLFCVKALHMRNYIEALNYQINCMKEIEKLLRMQRGSNWMLPVMYTLCLDLRLAAQRADEVSEVKGTSLMMAADSLMAVFRLCAQDTTNPEESSKRVGVLGPVNHLLRIYSRMEQFSLCISIIQAVEQTVSEGTFSMSQMVTFRYFVGRMAVVEGNFEYADLHLTYAFLNCASHSYKNKRTILTYLLPIKMLMGYMPVKSLCTKYNLPLYWQLLTAVKYGKMKIFEDILESNRRCFDNAGMMYALKHLRNIAYRNVLKKIVLSLQAHTIPMSYIRAALEMVTGKPVDLSAAQALVATMIYHRRIRAYMSYSNETVLFNRNNPFPRLTTLHYRIFSN